MYIETLIHLLFLRTGLYYQFNLGQDSKSQNLNK